MLSPDGRTEAAFWDYVAGGWESSLIAFAASIQFVSQTGPIQGWYQSADGVVANSFGLADIPLCNWTGVTCDDNNTIIGLDMASRGLNGGSADDQHQLRPVAPGFSGQC